jgi:MFS family permease
VHQDLGLSTFVVGLVTGSQFAASLISRVWSGRYADSRGAKRAVVVGLLTAVVGGLAAGRHEFNDAFSDGALPNNHL